MQDLDAEIVMEQCMVEPLVSDIYTGPLYQPYTLCCHNAIAPGTKVARILHIHLPGSYLHLTSLLLCDWATY